MGPEGVGGRRHFSDTVFLLLVAVVFLHNPVGIFDGPVDDLLKSLRIELVRVLIHNGIR